MPKKIALNGRAPSEPGPDGAGMYLYWDGRRNYRSKIPAPRVLQPLGRYSYGEPSGNRIVEGDNLQVMVSLRSQYKSSVDVAYLDPPYNTGKNDFRYSDKRFHDPNADASDGIYVSNEDGGRHTKWLNYMGPRLSLVWELLADHGVCFVSINEIELFRLGLLMDEIFDERNRVGIIAWKTQTDNNPSRITVDHEYILCYAKDKDSVPKHWVGESAAKIWLMQTYDRLAKREKDLPSLERKYKAAMKKHVADYKASLDADAISDLVDLGTFTRYNRVDRRGPYASMRHTENPKHGGYRYDLPHPVTLKACKVPPKGYRFSEETMRQLVEDDRIVFFKDHTQPVQLKRYLADVKSPLRSILDTTGKHGAATLKDLLPRESERFIHPKPVELLEQLLAFSADIDALVLDPFAGSGTTAHAVLRLNAKDGGVRRFLLIEEGEPGDPFCRTLTAARVKAAIKKEKLAGGFLFETTGTMLDRDAILDLERETIANLIMQTDTTGIGRGITKLTGKYVIGHNSHRQAIALCWKGRSRSTITSEVLQEMFKETADLGLRRPIRAYGSTCSVGETDSFHFCQIPDEIMAALQLTSEDVTDQQLLEEADSE